MESEWEEREKREGQEGLILYLRCCHQKLIQFVLRNGRISDVHILYSGEVIRSSHQDPLDLMVVGSLQIGSALF